MKKYIYIIISVLLLTGCTEEVEIELDSSFTRLVVYGEITTDTTTHRIELKESADYFFNKPATMISNAVVRLSFADSSLLLTESSSEPGIYETPPDFYGIPGETYTLTIEGVDVNKDGENENYSASSFLPPINSIDSIGFLYAANSFFSGVEILVWTRDPEGERNYYVFKALINGKLVTDTLTEFVIQNDDLFNGSYTYGITSQFLDDSKADERVEEGDLVSFEANGITEGYYNFLVQAQTESFGQNPLFSGPPANISSNISNGALGFFTAYSISRAAKVVPAEIPIRTDP